ncbi:hypothetical protein NDU88_006083 [Pleurodeles waltl]|uniref:Uncharacterized protein n=1 Tax=Pleurodeles waltl TaxID=8319 RepID=A0AAV7TD91_PLEWA|nr:hypothetical protein NDU88_006083 [Pleurodeles waltl]
MMILRIFRVNSYSQMEFWLAIPLFPTASWVCKQVRSMCLLVASIALIVLSRSSASPYRLSCTSGAAVPDHEVLLEVPGVSFVVVRTLRAWAPLLFPRPSTASVSPRPSGCNATRARSQPLLGSRYRLASSSAGAPLGQESPIARTRQLPRRSPRL